MKKIFAIFMAITLLVTLTGCNRQIIDLTHKYDRALIELANGEAIEVEIESWYDYDGEQIQIKAKDGTVYLTNSFRCDLIKDKD